MPEPKPAMPTRPSPIEAHQGTPMPGGKITAHPAGSSGFARAAGGAVAMTAISLLLNYLVAKLQQHFDQKRINNALVSMEPEIQAAVNQQRPEIERLLQQTNMRQTIYANVQVEIIYFQTIDNDPQGGGVSIVYFDTKLISVHVSTQNINRNDQMYRETVVLDKYDHYPFTHSFPLIKVELARDRPQEFDRSMAEVTTLLLEVRRDFSIAGSEYEELNQELETALKFLGESPTWEPEKAEFLMMSDAESFMNLRSAVGKAINAFRPPDPRLVKAKGLLDSLYLRWPGAVQTWESKLQPPQ
jgi:hypothetical protein